jgi:outer membrane receptor protein involved in Fe transport
LPAERNLQFDLGATYQSDRFLLGVRGFYSMIHNYILPTPSTFIAPFPSGVVAPTNLRRDYAAFGINTTASTAVLSYHYANLALATLAGGEIRAQYAVSDWITVNADLAYVKGVNHSPSRYISRTNQIVPVKGAEGLPGIYPFNATVRVLIAEPMEKKWGMEVVARMVHGQHYVADSLGELGTSGFTVFDLHGYYQVTRNVRVFSSILNLFNRNYTEHGSLAISNPQGTMLGFVPERGFTLMLGAEARY